MEEEGDYFSGEVEREEQEDQEEQEEQEGQEDQEDQEGHEEQEDQEEQEQEEQEDAFFTTEHVSRTQELEEELEKATQVKNADLIF